ncbi:hypothetical protein TrST_g3867 [Triparma strigata]|uniref:RRM domain-containing protein n=1 Tax=Triparma strigata TaxID=1606541 RepID=A0A9W6ZEL3_9STRA|nr:hypothetical protein TrST_g3867 [Triparma strigata]
MAMSTAGPAVSLMPPHIKMAFLPDPPLKFLPKPRVKTKKIPYEGIAQFVKLFETTPPPVRPPVTRIGTGGGSAANRKLKAERQTSHKNYIDTARQKFLESRNTPESTHGMDPLNTIFIGRLSYDVTEKDLYRFCSDIGEVKDLKIVGRTQNGPSAPRKTPLKSSKTTGYAFVEFSSSSDARSAYEKLDAQKLLDKKVVVDVERGNTVEGWLPMRLGGGIKGRRLGAKNVRYDGRIDARHSSGTGAGGPGMGMGGGQPMGMGGGPGYGGGGGGYGRGPPGGGYGGGGPPRGGGYGGGGGPGPYGGGGGGGGGGGYGRGPPGGGYGGPPPQRGYGGGGGGGYGGGGGPGPYGGGGGGGGGGDRGYQDQGGNKRGRGYQDDGNDRGGARMRR